MGLDGTGRGQKESNSGLNVREFIDMEVLSHDCGNDSQNLPQGSAGSLSGKLMKNNDM